MIYYDPTESRLPTRLDESVIDAGEAVQGLEAVTGADLLVTVQTLPTLNATTGPGKLALESACKSGILIQRKSGHDLLGSIPDLGSISARMNAVEPLAAYLAVDGVFECTEDGYVNCNGRPTLWHYNALAGALDAWQIYGGFVMQFVTGAEMARWILHRDRTIKKFLMDRPKTVAAKSRRQTTQLLIDPNPGREVLMAFPQVGEQLAQVILDYCGGNLAWALCWLSSDETIEGIGYKKKTMWRSFLGLEEGKGLAIIESEGGGE